MLIGAGCRTRLIAPWRRVALPTALALVVVALGSSGCGTGGLAVKKDVWEAQGDFERRQAGLSEKVLVLEGRIGALEEENAALRFELDELSKALSGMDSEFSRGLEAVRDGQQQLGIELESQIRGVDNERRGDRDDMLERMEIVLEEVTRENTLLREDLETLRSSVATGYTHTVKRGETLASIAAQYGVTIQAIASENSITNPNRIAVGQELFIPGR